MHIDPEILALIALGEPAASSTERDHLAECALCRSELASLSAAAAAGRATVSAPTLVSPDDRVWQGISASLGLGSSAAPRAAEPAAAEPTVGAGSPVALATAGTDGAPVGSPQPAHDPAPELAAAVGVQPGDSRPSVPTRPPATSAETEQIVTPPRVAEGAGSRLPATGDELATRRAFRSSHSARRRRTRSLRWLGVAAVVALAATLGGVGTALALRGVASAPSASPSSSILAAARLIALPQWQGATGDVVIEASGDSRSMTITVSDNTNRPDTFREVWLMNASLTKLVSIGLLATDSATFSIPAGIDMSVYTVVDVSSQPLDGNPAHSSNSIVRGSLAA